MPDITSEQKEHLEAMLAAIAEVAKHRDWLIADELRGRLPEFEEAEAKAAARVRELWEALKEPEAELARLNEDIAQAEGEAGEYHKRLDAADKISERVAARAWWLEWSAQLDSLNEKKAILERELEPVREAYEKAKTDADDARVKREAFELNVAIPLFGLGQGTNAFRAWHLEMGAFIPVLLSMDRGHFLWDAGYKFLDVVCLRSGYRTDHLPTDAENIKRSIENYAASKQKADVAPSGQEVMRADALRIQQMLETKTHVEDYRTPGLRIPMGRG